MNELTINTKRLTLHKIRIQDAEDVFRYRSDKDISKYQSFEPRNIKEVEDFIMSCTSDFGRENTWFQLGIYLMDKIIGDIGIHFIGPQNKQCEIGYTLAKEFQGYGYATESVISVVDYLFRVMNKHRIIASVDPENASSIRLLERIGFRKEGYSKQSILINGEWKDDLQYALLKEEWENLKEEVSH
jgi:RimJ/RimL family protein N-acetyltransferase